MTLQRRLERMEGTRMGAAGAEGAALTIIRAVYQPGALGPELVAVITKAGGIDSTVEREPDEPEADFMFRATGKHRP